MKRFSILVALILIAANLTAQTAKITGKAVDLSGALVVGADVTLIGAGNTAIAATKTGPKAVSRLKLLLGLTLWKSQLLASKRSCKAFPLPPQTIDH